jgi:superfamily II DNA or RNA helicase
MATGSGKTVTALSALAQLTNHVVKNEGKVVIVVAVPYIHLADQWEEEAEAFGYTVIKCFLNKHDWNKKVQDKLNGLSFESSGHLMLITVNATFSNEPFQKVLSDIGHTVVFVADEMHNLGSQNMLKLLPDKASFRLGLSATPDRHRDEQGTRALEKYFGERVIEFTLADAIKNGFLCEYHYYPVLVTLTPDEMCEYQELSAKISKVFQCEKSAKNDGPSSNFKLLLIKRSRLLSQASNKLIQLSDILKQYKNSSYNLIYCGDTIVDEVKYVDKTVKELGKKLKMKVAKFTATENKFERKVLLDQFSKGELQALVAIRCLDEGVDIPRTENAFILASSTNPREFIQRRGRVLRKSPGKKFARIYDFIVTPDVNEISWHDKKAFNMERSLLKRELERVNEFAGLAINGGTALEVLRDIKGKLNLLDS